VSTVEPSAGIWGFDSIIARWAATEDE